MLNAEAPDRKPQGSVVRSARWTFGRILWLGDAIITILSVLFSKTGLVAVALVLLLAAAFCGWIETPLQGVIRGYAYRLSGEVTLSDALTNPPRLLSFALPCLLGAGLTIGGIIWKRHWLPRHAGAALFVVVLFFPIGLISYNPVLVEAVVNQNNEREAILRFASIVDAYSATLFPIELRGTATLPARAATVLKVLGYGWWFALIGAGILLVPGVVGAGRTRPLRFVGGWGGVMLLILVVVSAPAVMSEYYRLNGERVYARGQYGEALTQFRKSIGWAPGLRENSDFQYRVGAALFWMGDDASPLARFFLAQNLRRQGEFEKAELQLTLALANDPHWKLARRTLAELNAAWGVQHFREEESGAISRWEQALTLDESLQRTSYYLARAYYELDGRDQSRAIAHAMHMIARTHDRGILSDVYGLLGDSYFKAHMDVEARKAYRTSLTIVLNVKKRNLQAQKGLLGL